MLEAILTSLAFGALIALVRRAPTSLAAPTLDPPIDSQGCSRKYFPSPNQNDSPRSSSPRLIVLHDTEGGASAASVAAYFFNPATKAAAHLVVDDSGACYRCADDMAVAWHANVVNPYALGIELVAPSGAYLWSRAEWFKHERMLEVAARRVAWWCRRWNIPVRFVDPAGLKAGKAGITTHAAVTEGLGGSHQDPGAGFPLEDFLRRVTRHLASTPRLAA